MTDHIPLPNTAEQDIPSKSGAPIGYAVSTYFAGIPSSGVVGNMGDIIELDAAKAIATQLLGYKVPYSQLSPADKAEVDARATKINQFNLIPMELDKFTLENNDGSATQKAIIQATNDAKQFLILGKEAGKQPLLVDSLLSLDATNKQAGFAATGKLYFVPHLNQADMDKLRAGGHLDPKKSSIEVSYYDDETKQMAVMIIIIIANDYDNSNNPVFFGDRDLKNPGYSAFTLSTDVSATSTDKSEAHILDTYRVEQRLKYLGFSAFDKGNSYNNQLQEFDVDGVWEGKETSALRGFYGATHRATPIGYKATTPNGISVSATTTPTTDSNLNWLNAYNAPHMVNVYSALGLSDATKGAVTADGRFKNNQTNKELYATSWVLDLMHAWSIAQSNLAGQTNVLKSDSIQINGLTSPPGLPNADSLHWYSSHSILMALDLGFNGAILSDIYNDPSDNNSTEPTFTATDSNGWSVANAINWAGRLSHTAGDNERNALINFLSLYNITIGDNDATNNNGSWEEIAVVNQDHNGSQDTVRTALFGAGTQAASLINHLYLGDGLRPGVTVVNRNSLPEMRTVLTRLLGANFVQAYDGHENHFHVDFRNPTRVAITPTHSLVTNEHSLTTTDADNIGTEENEFSPVLTLLAHEFNTTEDNLIMYAIPTPDAPSQHQIVVAAKKAPESTSEQPVQRAIGVCYPVDFRESEEFDKAYVSIRQGFRTYFGLYEPQVVRPPKDYKPDIKLVGMPAHGKIMQDIVESEAANYYLPDVGYLGDDKAVFEVSYEGKTVKVVYVFKVTKEPVGANNTSDIVCKGKDFWKISSLPTGTDSTTITYSNLINSAVDAFKGFSDLPAGEVGNTTGEGANASITLDVNAAGYGWFMDATPLSNEEFLPTADANIWVAKAGSAAFGKMDMFSVLLHEYGHALGLDHSAAGTDAMAATLKPGERRVWTGVELATPFIR